MPLLAVSFVQVPLLIKQEESNLGEFFIFDFKLYINISLTLCEVILYITPESKI